MNPLAHILSQLKATQSAILKDWEGGSFAFLLAAHWQKNKTPLFVLVEDTKHAETLKDEINFFAPKAKCQVLRGFDVRPYYGLSPHRQIALDQISLPLLFNQNKIDILIVTLPALMRRMVPVAFLKRMTVTLQQNDVCDRDELIQRLQYMGYERSSLVEDPGQFAVRGDILDLYSPHQENPMRINFFDIEIEKIQSFDPRSQRTHESFSEIQVFPAQEIFLSLYAKEESDIRSAPAFHGEREQCLKHVNFNWESDLKARADKRDLNKAKRDHIEDFVKNGLYFNGSHFFLPLFYNSLATLFDYFPKECQAVSFLDFPMGNGALSFKENMQQHWEESEHIESIFSPDDLFLNPNELDDIAKSHSWYVSGLQVTHVDFIKGKENELIIDGDTLSNHEVKLKLAAQVKQQHSLEPLVHEIQEKRKAGYECHIVCQNEVQRQRVLDLLKRFDLPLKKSDDDPMDSVLSASSTGDASSRLVRVFQGNLHFGFLANSLLQWWLTDEEIFGKKTRRATGKQKKSQVFSSFSEISEGDYLIHLDHGIGLYQGLIKLEYDVNKNDFLQIEYLGGDKLYVPIDKLNRVQRFMADEGAVPGLDKLGGKTWLKTRTKAKRAARKLAKELLEMQAKRAALKGHSYGAHHEEMEEFDTSFEFEETPDQMQAINDVLGDMESDRPMDRLVCGDVGYGKTEVAMRAAFKAVCDQRQVAVLVPTTVLAFQHFTSFKERFKDYPVKIELLSRFRSAKEQNDVINRLKTGDVDVVIGTHRLLSQDIRFSRLGLLVVDEEHRFGVIHKEKIKKMKKLVDVITLTATPIPRTLNFALNGIRDLSVINTPPVDRLAIKTYISYFDDATVRDAIMKELRRGGQVFFLHNRVQSIQKMCKRITDLIPEARVRFAHGQMEEGDLEEIMISFMNHEFDILVCTTIIESGIDIPNANTIIINRADNLGLAQLYQLRGRVGRSSRQAYCYLIIPDEALITEKAKKRLAVLQKFTELGSGFKIASRDLEIRGAGNILGDEQSGHIAAVGYDLYVHLLQEAINEIKNNNIPEDFEPEIQLQMAAKIPEDLIADQQLRLSLYKQVSSCNDQDDVTETREEWEDRFGVLPEEVHNLFNLIRIKIAARAILVSQIKQSGDSFFIQLHGNHQVDTQIFIDAIERNPKKFNLTKDGRFVIKDKFADNKAMTAYLLELLGKMQESVGSV
ncbi:MAG: transcription-repair coupling factor [Deltaproteobacteria bacterium]|nr:transcription-repair coupling factor [Deltaproteobacteria bacterium]